MSIRVENISKFYGAQKALDQVSFAAEKGQVVGFLGPNGAGKSTMMKILTSYIQPSEGKAFVSGFHTQEQPISVKKNIGYLPEHNPLYLDMYVREYLRFNAGIYKVSKKRTEEVIQMTGLFPEANKKIGQLSKGYRQRVGLAAALLHDPEVLILDEPTTGLDPNQLIEIRQLIKNAGKEKTVLLSTHIMQEVEAICDRVIIINKGKIVLDETMDSLKKNQQQIIEVEFDYRIENVAFQELPALDKVENPIDFVYHLYFKTSDDMRGKVFDFAHDNGLKILQLHQKSVTLEKLFNDLTATKTS
ncbi:MAG: gliding motility-associated ABC transporter ATP-binding subunit GldA [Bacteroidetes bacterium]|jgi:ABC-2 type transport system ATP-binding protein|nr:gliding motility-associated ABC transporter ATP-binding subunit GldA [Bacteroidota bacterium]